MACFEEHCRACQEELGEAFEQVHLWLDELAGRPGIGTRHRRYRHHLAGVEHVRKQWGDMAAQAAINHIRMDLSGEGWPIEKELPADGLEYVTAGLW